MRQIGNIEIPKEAFLAVLTMENKFRSTNLNFAIFMLSLLSITGLICLIDILFLKKNPEKRSLVG